MEELEQILREHAARYPKMQPTDIVKLIYQNEFGGGHLIRDEESCLQYLRKEYAIVAKDFSIPLYEDIGNGIVRVNLTALPEAELPWLGRSFLDSSAKHRGTLEGFLGKLAVLRDLTGQGIFGFDIQALDGYLAEYRQAGYPAVSHSQQYRETYIPAYRVVCREFLQG